MLADVDRARESNARFDDVKQLLQLAETERVTLMEEVEKLQEGTRDTLLPTLSLTHRHMHTPALAKVS